MEFDEKKEYEHGIAAARKDGKWGYIDSKGNVKIPFIYEYPIILTDAVMRGWIFKGGRL